MRRDFPLYDEEANAGSQHLGSAAANYDAKSAAYDPKADVEQLRALGLDRTKTVLELGAGTGRFAVAAARHAREVIAVDISPAMKEVFEQRRRLLWARRVRYVSAGFLSYVHEGDPVDFVYSRNAIQRLPDVWKPVALVRIREALKPGGVLYLRSLVFDAEPDDAPDKIEAFLAAAPTDPRKGFTREDSMEALPLLTYSWLMEAMLERSGFSLERARYGVGVFAEYICRRR